MQFSCICRILILLNITICTLYLSACVHLLTPKEPRCIEYRAAFDVGSEKTKMKVAKIDKCRQKKIEIISKKEVKVPYAENKPDNVFNTEIQRVGIAALQALKKEAIDSGAQIFAGVATAAFRQAVNAPNLIQEINNQTGISVKLISQDKEAILGYLAAVSVLGLNENNIVVWDIGSTSMQMILQNKDQSFIIYHGNLASISFKEKILTQIQHKLPQLYHSPNPIGKENLEKAVEIVTLAATEVPEGIKAIIGREGTIVIGIGGVHSESIKKQLHNKSIFRREDIMSIIQYKINLTDKEIGGIYADTEVSNLILVLGYMNKLGLNEVRLVDVNLADGILIDPDFW